MSSILFEKDKAGIVHFILDRFKADANLIDRAFVIELVALVEQLKTTEFNGVIIRSEKDSFIAGGDLDELITVVEDNVSETYLHLSQLKDAMRWLETCGKPVVACINGAALGGGWEIALACHYRIALRKDAVMGLPEVSLGLLPGAGGIVRMTRLLGLEDAMPFLLEGKLFEAEEGVELGLIHQLADTEDELKQLAVEWIKKQSEGEPGSAAVQPYDQAGYKVPGGRPSDPSLSGLITIAPAMLKQQTHGLLPAPEAILSVMVESLQVDIESAFRIESRYFVILAKGQIAKNMITAFWYQLNKIKEGGSRPDDVPYTAFSKVGVLGAGMMGAGIAYTLARCKIVVVLKDVSIEQAEKAKAYSTRLLDRKVDSGRMTVEQKDAILQRIKVTDKSADFSGCQLIIEAVPEDRNLKAQVTKEALQAAGEDVIMASNTSTLPISGLAQASTKPENFIGLHFFSPADKMPLVEIIKGERTSSKTLAAGCDLVQQIRKFPIVVNDSRGFYTSRVFMTYTQEGMRMLAEGIPAAVIENAAFMAGFPVGPLAVSDEVSLTLIEKIRQQTMDDLEAEGKTYQAGVADEVIDKLLQGKRSGKLAGAGFYEYPAGQKKHLWDGLVDLFKVKDDWDSDPNIIETLKDRLLFVQSLEAVRALEEGVVTSDGDANIGSIMGLGFPSWTGGAIQLVDHYGSEAYVQRAQQLCDQFGNQFSVPGILHNWSERTTL